jgi:hypothetical protein
VGQTPVAPGDQLDRGDGEADGISDNRLVTQVLKLADGLVAIRVPGPQPHQYQVGVWEVSGGRQVWWHDWADEVALLADTVVACVDDRLVRYSWPDFTEVDSLPAPDMAETLIVSPSSELLVVYQNDGQGENGYSVFSLDGPLRQVSDHIGLSTDPMYAMPTFSPSSRLIVAAPGNEQFWVPPFEDWSEEYEEEAEIPSQGGLTSFGTLLVHSLPDDVVTHHDLQFDLPVGWVPEDCWDARWDYGPIGLSFVGEDLLRVQLPDGTWVDLALPLPSMVLLPTPGRELPSLEEA